MSHHILKTTQVDVMLLLEGTFPYVRGGVSSWVYQIIQGFPEISFGAVFIGSKVSDYDGVQYPLPENLKHLEVYYLHDDQMVPPVTSCKGNSDGFDMLQRLHGNFSNRYPEGLPHELRQVSFYLQEKGGIDYTQFLYAERSWDYICTLYREYCSDPSFVDYFWTVRNMHKPIWQLATIAHKLIPAKAYHTVSTGYAGFLGGLLKSCTGRPLLLSEHGIYTKERRIDIYNNEWIQDNRNALQRDPSQISYLRDLWIRFFETLGRCCYDAADQIVSLFEGVRQRQIDDGAATEKITVIPNGIDLLRFSPLREQRAEKVLMRVALLGRVVPIKDVKTYIRAIRILANRFPEIEGWIVGPEGEDPDYVAECKSLVHSLDVGGNVSFTGFMNPVDLFPRIDLLVLASISEGLPLVALEGFAAGVPLVATDVGACRQLVEGVGEADRVLGVAGAIVPINNPQALADACSGLLEDRNTWCRAQQSATSRVEKLYLQEQMFARYRTLYQEALR